MQQIDIKCEGCGKKLLTYTPNGSKKYKSPLKLCKKCGACYADPRCHEIALEGIPRDEFLIAPNVVLMILGGLVLWRGIYLFGMKQMDIPDEMQWVLPTAFSLLGAIMIIAGITQIILIKTGAKAKKFERLKRESEQRLSDKSYAFALKQLGCNVPEKYL
ncbi:MAG: hypothetical protein ACI4JW_11780 [Oscillospiraceae bacterium]